MDRTLYQSFRALLGTLPDSLSDWMLGTSKFWCLVVLIGLAMRVAVVCVLCRWLVHLVVRVGVIRILLRVRDRRICGGTSHGLYVA
jgi:hypothetical protein